MALNVEDAGYHILDSLMFLNGQGFPKSHNFGCKCKGLPLPYSHEKTTESNSKSSMRSLSETDLSKEINTPKEPWKILFESVPKQDLQECEKTPRNRIEIREKSCMERRCHLQEKQGELSGAEICKMPHGIQGYGSEGRICNGTSSCDGQASKQNTSESRGGSSQGSQHTKQYNRESRTISKQSHSQNRRGETCPNCQGIIGFEGYGTALKPAFEPIILAMKPLDGTYKHNAEKWGLAGINIDECRIEGKRWPTHLILDEIAAEMLDQQSGFNASRFFYTPKASPSERNGSVHPTMKPLKLMEYLIKLVMPPDPSATLLDPFCGSGTTLLAAKRLGRKAIGIELEQEYCDIAKARLDNYKLPAEQFELFG